MRVKTTLVGFVLAVTLSSSPARAAEKPLDFQLVCENHNRVTGEKSVATLTVKGNEVTVESKHAKLTKVDIAKLRRLLEAAEGARDVPLGAHKNIYQTLTMTLVVEGRRRVRVAGASVDDNLIGPNGEGLRDGTEAGPNASDAAKAFRAVDELRLGILTLDADLMP